MIRLPFRHSSRDLGPHRRWSGLGLLSLLWVCLSLWAQAAGAAELKLVFFSIGQGDAALIVSPTGKRVLIDGGPPEGTPALLAGLARYVPDQIDLIVLSHPHLDHLGGLKRVVDNPAVPVKMFLDGAFPSTSPPYQSLLTLLRTKGIPVKQALLGRKIDLGDAAMLTILGPPAPWLVKTRSDVNANSVVVRLDWRGRSALFTGDAEPETEAWLLTQTRLPGQAKLLQGEVLKVAHHGGRFSSTTPFLQAVQPKLAVISVATVNDYKHPTPEAMDRITAVGARILRTDQAGPPGEIVIVSRDGKPWEVTGSRGTTTPSSFVAPPTPSTPTPKAVTPSAASVGKAAFVASNRAQVFHRADCPSAQKIVPENLTRFDSREAALASGLRPAADCNP